MSDHERLSRLRYAWNRVAITEADRTRRRIAETVVDGLDDKIAEVRDERSN